MQDADNGTGSHDGGAFASCAPPDLAPWVELIWYSRGTLPASRERVLPSATCDIVVNLGAPMTLLEGAGVRRFTGATTSGLLTRPLLLEHPHVHEALGFRLTPAGIRALAHAPAAAVLDLNAMLGDVCGAAARELEDRCASARSGAEVLGVAVTWARERCRTAPAVDPLATWAMQRIVASAGAVRVEALQERSGYGPTRFRQRFVDELGVSPRAFASLVRLRVTLDGLATTTPLVELALAAGYADQAHMNREVRRFTGLTPARVRERQQGSALTLPE